MMTHSLNRAAKQRIIRQTKKRRADTQWREVEIIDTDSRPSWKRYGNGVASLKVQAVIGKDGVALLEISASETALANEVVGEKRDVTKTAMFTAYGEAAFEIYELLREAFEPKSGPALAARTKGPDQ